MTENIGDTILGYDTGIDFPGFSSIDTSDVARTALGGLLGLAVAPLMFGSPTWALARPRSVLSRGLLGTTMLKLLKDKKSKASTITKGLINYNDEFADYLKNSGKSRLARTLHKLKGAFHG